MIWGRLPTIACMVGKAFLGISNLFCNVKFGIVLLVLLFVYMAIGSAGIVFPVHPNLLHPDAWVHAQVRQWRPFEMTEFEWFHWWPFDVLLALIATTMAWTTIRRIPFRVVNLGVWMIHTGIITLIAGSVWYFTTKVEGDAPVARRSVQLQVTASDGAQGTGSLIAMPGATTDIMVGREVWSVQVADIDPAWQLRTGTSDGERAYSIMLMVQNPNGRFMRQIIAGRPELSEDLIVSDDPKQPLQRAVKVKGQAIVEPGFVASTEYASQNYFYLKNDLSKSWALYLRKPGQTRWVMRPIAGLPLYNDYVPEAGLAFTSDGVSRTDASLDLSIPPFNAEDPFPSVTLKATGYLRYAFERSRLARGPVDAPLNPVARVVMVQGETVSRSVQLAAFDETLPPDPDDVISLRWAASEEALHALAKPTSLRIHIDGHEVDLPIDQWAGPDDEPRAVGPQSSGVRLRVVAMQERLKISDRRVDVAILDIESPHGTIRRWVFDDPALNRDMKPGESPDPKSPPQNLLPGITTQLISGLPQTPVTLVAGPDPAHLTLIDTIEGEIRSRTAVVGEALQLSQGVSLRVDEYLARAIIERRPFIVPEQQRVKDAREQFAMALVQAPSGEAAWLAYHDYPFERAEDVLYRRDLNPTTMRLADGTVLEMIFSRQRLVMPDPIALETFDLATHEGGFTGESTTIRDYVSLIRFQDRSGAWSDPARVSVNQPVEHGGLWFFQAQWDPPNEGDQESARSLGLNYTVLGVGSRKGVEVQLAGCILAVMGMVYAFYVKPVIKRRALKRQIAAAIPKVMGTVAAWLVLVMPLVNPLAASAMDRETQETEFQSAIDLEPLEQAAVMSDGRIKSLGSLAFGYLHNISGGRAVEGQSPTFTLLDMAIRPEAYEDADVIRVKNREVRLRMAEALRSMDPSLTERLRGFESHGMIAPSLVWNESGGAWRPDIAPLMQQMQGDLIRTAKQIDFIRGAVFLMRPAEIRAHLKLVPSDRIDQQWGTLDHEAENISKPWQALQAAWRAGDVAAAQQAIHQLSTALHSVETASYPSDQRLAWESWYFRTGQMTWVWCVYFMAVTFLVLGFSWKWPTATTLGLMVFAAAFVLQTSAVGLRWFISDRWPNSNMFEAVTTASWMGAALAVCAECALRSLPVRGLFALCASVGCMVALMACAMLPAQLNPAIGNMMPVLHDVWLYIHTNVVIFSYALIFMAAITATMYLVWRWQGGQATYARVGGAGEMIALASGEEIVGKGRVGEILDGVTMTLMELSFVLLWSGIVMGAIWADHSWGRPWGWDPKEVFALNTFVVFALLIHVRWRSKDKGLWTAVLAVLGAGVMLFNWIVINFVITGLHSYA